MSGGVTGAWVHLLLPELTSGSDVLLPTIHFTQDGKLRCAGASQDLFSVPGMYGARGE